ncbi:MAG: major capsid protein [Microvirus sp.]|nr:MAG: major capsid protein [Microvirus sp.]
MMHRNKSVNVHSFAMVPQSDVPRSSFRMERKLTTAFDSGLLIPCLCEEMLPGDTFNLSATQFGRLTTPIVPFMDNLYMDTHYFFVPNRLVWANWVKFMGEQASPGDNTSFNIPQMVSQAGGYVVGSIFDYFGLPTAGQVAGANTVTHSALPLRAYALIFNQWFRDENLVTPFGPGANTGDGPDLYTNMALMRRGKRHDYFTSALPWLQKSTTSVTLPLGSTAPVIGTGVGGHGTPTFWNVVDNTTAQFMQRASNAGNAPVQVLGGATTAGVQVLGWNATALVADLSTATAATINQIRQAFQLQKLLEKDARGGTRYTEVVRAHFGVASPDARLQRPEYLGGGSQLINVSPIAQTSATGVTGSTTPGGNLNAVGHVVARNGFTYSSVEHGYVIGLVSVRADLTYQQGLRRHWSRLTRQDYYFPVFAMLGEQAILNKEIYCDGSANDALVFGYQERWGELRYLPSEITGKMRSTAAGTLDVWHAAQKFTGLPTLNQTFIEENPPIARLSAVPSEPQIKMDQFVTIKAARPLPMYSVPGLIDHF